MSTSLLELKKTTTNGGCIGGGGKSNNTTTTNNKLDCKRKRISFGHVEYISVVEQEEDEEEEDDEKKRPKSVSTVHRIQLFNLSLNLKINGVTPKRRLSYNYTKSMSSDCMAMTTTCSGEHQSMDHQTANTPEQLRKSAERSPYISSSNKENEGSGESAASSTTTPFIKRKCLIDQSVVANSNNNSPLLLSTNNLNNASLTIGRIGGCDTPTMMNDSLEDATGGCSDKASRDFYRFSSRRASKSLFSKHRSAPQTALFNEQKRAALALTLNLAASELDSHRLNDSNSGGGMDVEMSAEAKQQREVDDLEEIFFGKSSTTTTTTTVASGEMLESIVSERHELIRESLEIDASIRNLIGDRSMEHILPTVSSNKHQDLNCISPQTVVEVLEGIYSDQIHECIIVDARYPYEFDGGHIQTALNIYTKEDLYESMFMRRLQLHNQPPGGHMYTSMSSNCLSGLLQSTAGSKKFGSKTTTTLTTSTLKPTGSMVNLFNNNSNDTRFTADTVNQRKRTIIIFHCEFSSERGPTLLKFLRSQDRSLNEHTYPNLYYPELYLLEGGYKAFYEKFKDYCEPKMYKPMAHAEHLKDLKHFRAKAKSWEASRHSYMTRYNTENTQFRRNPLPAIPKSDQH